MESTSLTFTLQPGQPQFLCASEVQFLHCTQGALQLEWEQAGIPYQHVLHGGGMPWQPLQVPVGTWLRLSVIGTRSATLIQECSAPSVGMGTTLLPDLAITGGIAGGDIAIRAMSGETNVRSIGLAWRRQSGRAKTFREIGAFLRTWAKDEIHPWRG